MTTAQESIAKALVSRVPGVNCRLSYSQIHLFNDEKQLDLFVYQRPATLSVQEAFHGTEAERNQKLSTTEYVLKGEVDNCHHTELELVVNVSSDQEVEFADYYPLSAIKKHFSIGGA